MKKKRKKSCLETKRLSHHFMRVESRAHWTAEYWPRCCLAQWLESRLFVPLFESGKYPAFTHSPHTTMNLQWTPRIESAFRRLLDSTTGTTMQEQGTLRDVRTLLESTPVCVNMELIKQVSSMLLKNRQGEANEGTLPRGYTESKGERPIDQSLLMVSSYIPRLQ